MESINQRLPDTSLEAYRAVTPEQLREMYVKIQWALKSLGKANYEAIADFLNLPDRNMVSRRLKEMEGLEMIYKPGTKSLTTRKRNAYDYSIRNSDTILPPIEKFNPTETSAADYANMIIAGTKQGKLVQKDLWEGAD